MISSNQISLVISTYNHVRPLELCLAGFRNQTTAPMEILIADDGSASPTRDLIVRLAPTLPCPVHHLWHEDRGFRKNAILNQSLAAAKGTYLVFTDADCIPHPRFIEDHASLAEQGFWVQGRRSYLNAAACLYNLWAPSLDRGGSRAKGEGGRPVGRDGMDGARTCAGAGASAF